MKWNGDGKWDTCGGWSLKSDISDFSQWTTIPFKNKFDTSVTRHTNSTKCVKVKKSGKLNEIVYLKSLFDIEQNEFFIIFVAYQIQ